MLKNQASKLDTPSLDKLKDKLSGQVALQKKKTQVQFNLGTSLGAYFNRNKINKDSEDKKKEEDEDSSYGDESNDSGIDVDLDDGIQNEDDWDISFSSV